MSFFFFFLSHIVFVIVLLVFFLFRFSTSLSPRSCAFVSPLAGFTENSDRKKPPVPGKMTLIFSVQNFGQIVNCIFCSSIAAARVGRKVASLKGFKSFSLKPNEGFFCQTNAFEFAAILIYS